MPRRKQATTTVVVTLRFKHDEGIDVRRAVDRVLDRGEIQDAVLEYVKDNGYGTERITCESAVSS